MFEFVSHFVIFGNCIFDLYQDKPKMGTMESIKFLVSSKYIRDLATLVVAYGISINLVEVTWKSKLKAQVNYFTILSQFILQFDSFIFTSLSYCTVPNSE